MTWTTAAAYRKWAEIEADGVSPTYFDWAMGIAESPDALDLIAGLPLGKRQPNLVFGAARFVGAAPGPSEQFIRWLIENWDRIRPVILERATQTNEAGRCAVLLPVLSRLAGPLALIEAGASAGLCLYPDRYSYRYTSGSVTTAVDPPPGDRHVVLPCSIDESSIPVGLPDVVWRAGVDLNPLDPTDDDDMAWLSALVWPEHGGRLARLQAAASIAASDPPHLVRGDLLDRLPSLIEQAPAEAQIVVFHSAVLAYLAPARRDDFRRLAASYPGVVWISNEGGGVLPDVTSQVNEDVGGRLIVSVDGKAVALAGAHGQSYQAIARNGARDTS